MQKPAMPAAVVEVPMQEPALTTEKVSVQNPAAPEEASVQETAVFSVPEEPPAGNREKGEKEGAASTRFTFDSYSTYRKAREKVNELIEKVFSRDIPVTVKIVCMEG